MDPDKTRGIERMDCDNDHFDVQRRRIYQLGERIYRARELSEFKAVTKNLVENSLRVLNEISTEEMQGENPSPFLLEKYSLLNHYLDYLKRLCEGTV